MGVSEPVEQGILPLNDVDGDVIQVFDAGRLLVARRANPVTHALQRSTVQTQGNDEHDVMHVYLQVADQLWVRFLDRIVDRRLPRPNIMVAALQFASDLISVVQWKLITAYSFHLHADHSVRMIRIDGDHLGHLQAQRSVSINQGVLSQQDAFNAQVREGEALARQASVVVLATKVALRRVKVRLLRQGLRNVRTQDKLDFHA